MIAYPFRLLQCCLVTDGGGALILVSSERAKDFPQKPVYLLGTGESVETPMVSQMADFTSSRAFRVAGAKAFAEAGITHNDVDRSNCRGLVRDGRVLGCRVEWPGRYRPICDADGRRGYAENHSRPSQRCSRSRFSH
jgi:hypothetical protein